MSLNKENWPIERMARSQEPNVLVRPVIPITGIFQEFETEDRVYPAFFSQRKRTKGTSVHNDTCYILVNGKPLILRNSEPSRKCPYSSHEFNIVARDYTGGWDGI